MKLRTRTIAPATRRLTLSLAAVSAAALALSGCGVGGGENASGTDELTVVVEGGGLAELQPIADAYKEETGTKVTLVELPYDGLYDRISSELSSGQVSFDVAALDAIWLSAFADGVTPLDDLFTDDVKSDLFPGLVSEAQVNDAFVGMPVWTNSEILFYRTDLFEDPAEQAAFQEKYGYELAPPTDWEQYRDVAEFFTRDTDGDGQVDLYGTDVKGAVETEWLATVSQAGEEHMVLDAESGEVTIDDAEHLEALDYYTSLLPFAPSGAAQLDWAGAQNLFYQGQLAMMRFWGHAYTGTPEDSVVKDSIGAAPMIAGPGGIAGVPGAWYLSVPTATDKQEEAKDFIAYAYEHNELSMDSWLGLAARISAFESKQGEEGKEHYAALLETLNAPQTLARPATPQWQEIVDTVLTPLLQKAVEPGADNAALLAEAKAQIEAIVE
ncbi:ABC-type glycerol-3-phosphate transport system substrate-binding protein [Agromyces flavus]|uniref:ABC-type glycerol-3-phosphate transport system substrate-binding protein n=1 Tax=Agromyces flavus TaxID=589382 RepID=A0A1H2A093_9MICO|nr:sugar ABC transporter substrate-binding protein [Agromyces flavus]MCP2367368.1 ABC-type glycerol-3-phosphate transport system substrate-binding protein [Agromyces flavus]GGI45866.1 ABC transporter substrate-binding protein [Agromyces flavus]SDT39428.1 ABC-type glycerol-3-phosphate transport system, substrate-binding protein [Agromyces flavus]